MKHGMARNVESWQNETMFYMLRSGEDKLNHEWLKL